MKERTASTSNTRSASNHTNAITLSQLNQITGQRKKKHRREQALVSATSTHSGTLATAQSSVNNFLAQNQGLERLAM